MDGEIKQVIVIRKDLKMGKGKMAAQAAHASVGSFGKCDRETAEIWEREGAKKIVLGVGTLDELLELEKKAKRARLPHFLVTDAGRTEFNEPTTTCLGIGPAQESEIDKLTGHLKLVS